MRHFGYSLLFLAVSELEAVVSEHRLDQVDSPVAHHRHPVEFPLAHLAEVSEREDRGCAPCQADGAVTSPCAEFRTQGPAILLGEDRPDQQFLGARCDDEVAHLSESIAFGEFLHVIDVPAIAAERGLQVVGQANGHRERVSHDVFFPYSNLFRRTRCVPVGSE